MHQIGVLPILTYAEDHYELLSDPISLNHVIDRIHPLLGDKLLRVWEFPEMLVQLPGLYLDFKRQSERVDYVDLVQVASLYCHKDTDHPLARIDLFSVPAFKKSWGSIRRTRRCARIWRSRGRCFTKSFAGKPRSYRFSTLCRSEACPRRGRNKHHYSPAIKLTRTFNPACSPSCRLICARWARQISPTMAKPSPDPATCSLRR